MEVETFETVGLIALCTTVLIVLHIFYTELKHQKEVFKAGGWEVEIMQLRLKYDLINSTYRELKKLWPNMPEDVLWNHITQELYLSNPKSKEYKKARSLNRKLLKCNFTDQRPVVTRYD